MHGSADCGENRNPILTSKQKCRRVAYVAICVSGEARQIAVMKLSHSDVHAVNPSKEIASQGAGRIPRAFLSLANVGKRSRYY